MKPVTYFGSDTPVLVGDHVEFWIWLFFWKGWTPGRVHYVPGISPRHAELEHDDLTWVSIHEESGARTGCLVNPETGSLDKTVRFVRRSDDALTETPDDYRFEEDG